MKKIAVSIILIALVVSAAIPIASGFLAKRVVVQSVEEVNSFYAESGYDISVEILKYDRQLFNSEIEWKIDFGSLQNLYGTSEIIFYDRAKHGYRGIRSHTSLEKNSWYQSFVDSYLNGVDPLTIVTTYNIIGNIESLAKLESFSFEKDGEQVVVKSGFMVMSCDQAISKIKADLSWEGGQVQERLILEALEIHQNMKKVSDLVWQGDMLFTLGTLQFPNQQMDAGFQNVSMDYTLSYDQPNDKLNMFSHFGVGSMVADVQSMKDLSFIFAIENLDRQAFEDFMAFYGKTTSAIFGQLKDAENDQQKNEIIKQQATIAGFQMMSAFERLLTKDLTLKFSDFAADLTDGSVEADLMVVLKEKLSLAQLNGLSLDPDLITDFFDMELDISFPETLLDKKEALIVPLRPQMKTGLFLNQNGRLMHQSRILNDTISLNGNEIVLKDLLN
ncbi:MAG: DUF945 family protein [Desulfobulbaceae bacterium]|nr:MAG: DUF945 family protein [Desulfobulbaceae bacterium]